MAFIAPAGWSLDTQYRSPNGASRRWLWCEDGTAATVYLLHAAVYAMGIRRTNGEHAQAGEVGPALAAIGELVAAVAAGEERERAADERGAA